MPRRDRLPLVPLRAFDGIRAYRRDGTRTVHSPGLHGHLFFSMLFVEKGEGDIRLLTGICPLEPGIVHLTVPGEMHDTSALHDVEGWVLEFSQHALGPLNPLIPKGASRGPRPYWLTFFPRSRNHPLRVVVPESHRCIWSQRFAVLSDELGHKPLGYRDAASARLQLFLIEMARFGSAPDTRDPTNPLVDAVFEVIEARYAEDISLDAVARAVHRSKAHLTTIVRDETGLTVLEWITERRMVEARRLLQETTLDVAEIAEKVGYADSTYFDRVFRRAQGVTPRAWRLGIASDPRAEPPSPPVR